VGSSGKPVLIIGGGLAGSLLALALVEQGVAVQLLDGGGAEASRFSYGVMVGFAGQWRRMQGRHGELGLRQRRIWPPAVAQVDTAVLWQRLPALLASLGVEICPGVVAALRPDPQGWRISLADGSEMLAPQLVLAAGAGCRRLWPELPAQLRSSWAGVLELCDWPVPCSGLRLPGQMQRLRVERQVETLERQAWVVDAGLVPWGTGGLLGQLSLISPGLLLAEAPQPQQAEARLRQALLASPLAEFASLPGTWRQMQVAYSSSGIPLVGAVPQAPGLWVFSGFSGAYASVPPLARGLALAMAADPVRAGRAQRALHRQGVWPRR
jgi:glycine/D-amino acid oxidase-like deaminating enzyme